MENVYSEGNFYTKDGLIYSDAIVIKFKENVIPLTKGVISATKDQINVSYSDIKQLISNLEMKYGKLGIERQIPDAVYGDTQKRHKITGKFVQTKDYSQLFTLRFSNPVPLDSILNVFKETPEVEYAHQPVIYKYHYEPNDPYYQQGIQWNLDALNAEGAWNISKGNTQIKVGIVDDGIMEYHEDIQGKIAGGTGYFYKSEPHGTWVAGVLAAKTDNNIGIASLGFNLKIYNYGGPNTVSTNHLVAQRIVAATNANMDIINMSFGTLKIVTDEIPITCPDPQDYLDIANPVIPHSYQEMEDAIEDAVNLGIICIASAGNTSLNDGPNPELCDPMLIPFHNYPSEYPGVIAVSGTELSGLTERFKSDWNFGSFIDVSAPGANIYTTDTSGGYYYRNGTSFSAPQVCALAGLILSINPSLTSIQVENILKNTADKIDAINHPYANGRNDYLGYGRINAYNALKYTLENYGGTLTQSFTIPAGEIWNIQPGVEIKFASGVTLTVNGTFNAIGTSTNKINFSRSGTSGTWGGIRFNSGSSGSLKYCEISNATEGIYCNNTSAPLISNNNIYNCYSSGIHLYYSSPRISYNSITNNGVYGIHCDQYSSPVLYNNIISGHLSSGLRCYYYSSPWLSNKPSGGGCCPGRGYNIIRENAQGIQAAFGSNVFMGDREYGGYNCVHNNSSYEFSASYNSGFTMKLEKTWWNHTTYPYYSSSDFYIYTSSLDYDPAYPGPDPNGCPNPPLPKSFAYNKTETSEITEVESKIQKDDELNDIFYLEIEGKNKEAISLYLEKFKNEKDEDFKKAILVRIAECYRTLDQGGFTDFLMTNIHPLILKNDKIYAASLELENIFLMNEKKFTKVIENLNNLKTNFSNDETYYKNALFALSYIHSFYLNEDKKQRIP